MKPPHFTLRALMIVVALASLAAWGYVLWRQSAEFAARAREHEEGRSLCDINLAFVIGRTQGRQSARLSASARAELEAKRARLEQWVHYEQRMYLKYRRAARFPWLPISPDPVPPTAW
jgi:hypothetical protein